MRTVTCFTNILFLFNLNCNIEKIIFICLSFGEVTGTEDVILRDFEDSVSYYSPTRFAKVT